MATLGEPSSRGIRYNPLLSREQIRTLGAPVMKILGRWLFVPLLLASSTTLYADENSDKLDAILNEITRLHERVKQLEIRVGRLTAETRVLQQQQRATRGANPVQFAPTLEQLQKLKRVHDAESTIRLQQESPGELLKNIHERERALRNRPFPADLIPY